MTRKNPKIIVIGPDLEKSNPGGIVTVISLLLASDLKKKFEFTLAPLDYWGTPIRQILYFSYSCLQIIWKLSTKQFDLIYFHISLYPQNWPKFLFLKFIKLFSRKKILLHIHGGLPSNLLQRKKFFSWCFKNINHYWVLTQDQKDQLSSLFSIPSTMINLIPNYLPSKSQGTPKVRNQFLFLSRLVKEKGVMELLSALNDIKAELPQDYKMIIAGDGPYLAQAKQLSEEYELTKWVDFPGYVSGWEKQKLLDESEVFILPSYQEAFPMSILEAMDASNFIISSNVGSIFSMLDDGKIGYLIPPKNTKALSQAMLNVLNLSPEQLAEYQKEINKNFNEHYRLEKVGVSILTSRFGNIINRQV